MRRQGRRDALPLAEFGMVTRQGIAGVGMLIPLVEDDDHDLIAPLARSALLSLIGRGTHAQVMSWIMISSGPSILIDLFMIVVINASLKRSSDAIRWYAPMQPSIASFRSFERDGEGMAGR